jgi:hypothetical protein
LKLIVPVLDERELWAKLQAGHRVEYRVGAQYIISQKRGDVYVTASGMNEADAEREWKRAHEKGFIRDEQGNRVTVPGAR